tara:strand:- start:182 stop:643 length:462 start_codon:yes stop_codon:yes gene_type:complete
MLNNDLKNYLIQTQQLFGDNLTLYNKNDFFVIEEGNSNSKIVFIKESLNNNSIIKEEKILFSNILKALKLSYDDIFLISISNDKKNIKFSDSFNKLSPLVIVTFGLSISKIFLNNRYKGINVISTYSLMDIINDLSLKKHVWKDLKPILSVIK